MVKDLREMEEASVWSKGIVLLRRFFGLGYVNTADGVTNDYDVVVEAQAILAGQASERYVAEGRSVPLWA